jgi:hypothetical protein
MRADAEMTPTAVAAAAGEGRRGHESELALGIECEVTTRPT